MESYSVILDTMVYAWTLSSLIDKCVNLKERLSKSWDVITPFEEPSVIEGRRWKLAF